MRSETDQKTAWDIYERGYSNSIRLFGTGQNRKPNDKEYFVLLQQAVKQEIESQGFCSLLDTFQIRHSKIDPVTFGALIDLWGILTGKSKGVDVTQTDFVPYALDDRKEKFLWGDTKTETYRLEYTVHIEDLIAKLKEAGQKKHLSWLRSLWEQLREKSLDNTLEHSCRQQLSERKMAEDEWEKSRQSILSNARKQADDIILQARTEGGKIAAQVREEAEREKERILEEAEHEKTRILEETDKERRDRARIRAQILVNQYLDIERFDFKRDCEANMEILRRDLRESSGELERVHDDMCTKTNQLQAEIGKALAEYQKKLEEMREGMYNHLHTWQAALYPYKYKPLAERYVELYKFVNADKLVSELLSSLTESADSPYRIETEKTDEQITVSEKRDREIISRLMKLQKNMTVFLHQFEASLKGIGLYVYYPEEGSAFDDIWHVCEDEAQDPAGKTIRACLVPGVARRMEDIGEDDPVIPAVVRVE